MSRFIPPGLGWQPSLADPRDYTLEHPRVQALIDDLKIGRGTRRTSVDLREFFPEAEHQGALQASCAFAVLGLVEYFEARCREPPLEASRLFHYQTALRMRGTTDDIGVDLRTALKTLRRFGAPPQPFWPYQTDRFDQSPTDPFLFGFARDYEHVCYFRLENRPHSAPGRLPGLKSALAAGFPFLLGFQVPTTLAADGLICSLPSATRSRGGQAALAVGFEDAFRIGSHKGALLIRNSWGSQWGDQGYGWLPYDLVEQETAPEFWTMISQEWVAAAEEW